MESNPDSSSVLPAPGSTSSLTAEWEEGTVDQEEGGASLVVQWLRIHLPMKNNGLDPWSGKITHPVNQPGPRAPTTDPSSRAHEPQLLKPTCLEPAPHNKRSPSITARECPLLAAARESQAWQYRRSAARNSRQVRQQERRVRKQPCL